MPWAIVVAEARDRLGIELDPPGRRLERVRPRVGPIRLEKHRWLIGNLQFEVAGLPKNVERREVEVALRRLLPRHVVQMPQPLHLAAPLGELRLEPQALGEGAVDLVLRPRLAD